MHYINMVDISRKTYEKKGVEITVDNDGILWVNEKHIEEGLNHKNIREITIKYHSDHRKHRYDLDIKSTKTMQQICYRRKLRNQSNYGLQNNIGT